ncbi:hypothetical protein CPU03_00585 [Edwardsiella tarda]|nr:hypothetical protein CPU03_00585 [Edwardsiella tarda]
MAWLGLAWLGLAWLGLAWLGLAWLGLAWQATAYAAERQSVKCDAPRQSGQGETETQTRRITHRVHFRRPPTARQNVWAKKKPNGLLL